MIEIWKPIPGFPNHQASSLGNIRRTTGGKGRAEPGLIHKQTMRPNGYAVVSISGQKQSVHRLVCLAFHGEPSPGHEVSHENGDGTDNRAVNLRWRTHAENVALTAVHGTRANGTKCHSVKLDETAVLAIRAAARVFRPTHKELAHVFGVSRASVGDVINYRTWRHIE